MIADRRVGLPTFRDDRGTLSVASVGSELPFAVERVFFLYDLSVEEERGGHAHREVEEVVVCVRGACRLTLDDGVSPSSVILDSPSEGAHVPRMHWITLQALAPGTVIVVMASHLHDEGDYIRSRHDFDRLTSGLE